MQFKKFVNQNGKFWKTMGFLLNCNVTCIKTRWSAMVQDTTILTHPVGSVEIRPVGVGVPGIILTREA